MRIVFCDSVIDASIVEPDYLDEKNAALSVGFGISLISFEALIEGNVSKALQKVQSAEKTEKGIYRGWMLTPLQYQNLYEGLLGKNIQLINSPQNYQHCHYLPDSYSKIEQVTPKSNWSSNTSKSSILDLTNQFGNSPIIVKDFVKSEKHNWGDACYIPDASDAENVMAVVEKFLELRGSALNEGVVFRQFEELEFLTQHSKSGMPLTKEFRIFFVLGEMLMTFNYWDEGEYGDDLPEMETFLQLAKNIENNFFSMDVAKKKNGEWIIMELGDGQVAGLPDNANRNDFYHSLMQANQN